MAEYVCAFGHTTDTPTPRTFEGPYGSEFNLLCPACLFPTRLANPVDLIF
jgi:hypothetical protein